MNEFEAGAAAFVRDARTGLLVLALAEHPDGSGSRLELQRAIEPTANDRQLGIDAYALVNETGATHYGGVDGWRLDGNEVSIALSSAAARALGVERGYTVRLAQPSMIAHVASGLEAILGADLRRSERSRARSVTKDRGHGPKRRDSRSRA